MLYIFIHEDTTYFGAVTLETRKESLQKFNTNQIISWTTSKPAEETEKKTVDFYSA